MKGFVVFLKLINSETYLLDKNLSSFCYMTKEAEIWDSQSIDSWRFQLNESSFLV